MATNRTKPPLAAVSGDARATDVAGTDTGAPQPTVVTLPATIPVEYFCTDPIGEDQLGRQLFGACEPVLDDADGDYACVGRIGTEDGFVIFSSCEPVGQLGPVPSENGDASFEDPDDVAVRATAYVVQPGDDGFKLATEFCVSIADLEAVNDWTDSSSQFPGVGSEILIPEGDDESTCEFGSYTITEDDTTRIGVADKFCISVQALDSANIATDGYDVFFPGLAIIVPPSSDGTC